MRVRADVKINFFVWMGWCVGVWVCLCVWVCVVCADVIINLMCGWVGVCVCVCVCVCVYIHIYIYMYTHTHTRPVCISPSACVAVARTLACRSVGTPGPCAAESRHKLTHVYMCMYRYRYIDRNILIDIYSACCSVGTPGPCAYVLNRYSRIPVAQPQEHE